MTAVVFTLTMKLTSWNSSRKSRKKNRKTHHT